jgi:hypothetical protein
MQKQCANCGNDFETVNQSKTLCRVCGRKERERCLRRGRPVIRQGQCLGNAYGLSNGSMGALSEMVVCADLLRKGYEVFRAVSPSCSCDLIVQRNNKQARVEVRTGRRLVSGDIHAPFGPKDAGRQDVLAIVVDGVVEYRPSLI